MRVLNRVALLGFGITATAFVWLVVPHGAAVLPEVAAVGGMVLSAALWQRERERTDAHARLSQAEALRLAAEEQLRHADRLTRVGQLAAGVAHELGTPLNVARLHADMIASGEVEASTEIAAAAQSIMEQCDRMALQLRRLLNFARARAEEASAPLAVGELLGGVLALLRPVARKSGVTLAPLEGGDDGLVVHGNGFQLQQVFLNLGMNAIHAMPGGGTLTVRARREGSGVVVEVEDTGEGMPPEVQARIFEPFFTTKPPGQGTGLGLSVCQSIVAEHGGRIAVESRRGEGSCFRVWLMSV